MKKLELEKAFIYPFARKMGLLNALWILLPIIGWWALFGYKIKILREVMSGKVKQLPEFNFFEELQEGFFMFFKFVPFMVACVLFFGLLHQISAPIAVLAQIILGMLLLPILYLNFVKKGTVASAFEIKLINNVWDNLGDYLWTLLKCFFLGMINLFLFLFLIGIPASLFTKNIFLADFYKRNVKK